MPARERLTIIEEGDEFQAAVVLEVDRARINFPPFNSAHEGYAILAEEVDELWDEVKVKQKNRDPAKMYAECVQVAAMAQRLAVDIVAGGRIGV